eukprot:CAMPEP_0173420810 /NCGR_PEP_ID=MMETSP1357-20121228/2141_1 /TAXON_ID=77926 /ORGANISM="Hemiselmis rufescens, Strain PCC563" /LENGTH=78 /DNA_ID=CAMNT_0014383639 /DNA_START=73 /DNA_END=310 /DNA_ORIENTATION=+
MTKPTAHKDDKHSHGAYSDHGKVKKDQATWGAAGNEEAPLPLDKKDPNYDSSDEKEGSRCSKATSMRGKGPVEGPGMM